MTRKSIILLFVFLISTAFTNTVFSQNKPVFVVHLKTALGKDDAQICVAYNVIWAALDKGYDVRVLVDASAIDTFKKGWLSGKDDISGYKIPENLRTALSKQFNRPIEQVPRTYGDFLEMLHRMGAKFYINKAYLIVSKAGTPEEPLKKITVKFFKPVSIMEMLRIREMATIYMVY
jgi:hypothetical protein